MLKTFWNNFVGYIGSLSNLAVLITIGLLVLGTANALVLLVSFNPINLSIAILDLGIVYYGYAQYAKRLS